MSGSADALTSLEISGLAYDSRKIKAGDAFFCIVGEKSDGNKFIADAIRAKAGCILSESSQEQAFAASGLDVGAASPSTPFIQVKDIRLAMAVVSDYFYNHPSRNLRLIGVTGTNGKTTTTHLIEHILLHAGQSVGLIGTLGARISKSDSPSEYIDTKHTTPQASDLQALLAEMKESGVNTVAMEVSSHALALKRTAATSFATACLTNITQDHLDFHHSMEHYWQSKRILFEQLSTSEQSHKTAILNADDSLCAEFKAAVTNNVRLWTYGWHEQADARVEDVQYDFNGTQLTLKTPKGELKLSLQLNGKFNVYNVMAALLACLAENIDLETCKSALESFTGVPGRFQAVKSDKLVEQPLCIVDYAHTPDGLENILKTARPLVREHGRLIVIFGCGGDRDATKRPKMAEIADRLADQLFVTSDNPRSEVPQKIIADILVGVSRTKDLTVEPDRALAISQAIASAGARDVVVVAGKGHETYQILADRTIDFDDRAHVKSALDAKKLK